MAYKQMQAQIYDQGQRQPLYSYNHNYHTTVATTASMKM
jgi:hypothetical protein